jgi:uncharacterized membrane protein (DUF373 family)
MSEGGDEQEAPRLGAGHRARLAPPAGGVTRSIRGLEHAQDVVTVVVGVVLLLLSAALLVSGIADFVHALSVARVLSAESITAAATALLDDVLLVLILIEIVHTVVLSLHSHRLAAQPFVIVGLVAVIRKILFVLSGQKQVATSVLALLIAMVAVFILGLVVVSRFEKSVEPDLSRGACSASGELKGVVPPRANRADSQDPQALGRVQGGRRRVPERKSRTPRPRPKYGRAAPTPQAPAVRTGRPRAGAATCSGNVHGSNACANGRKCAMLRLGGQRQQRLTTQVSGSTTAHALARCCE